MKKYGIITLLLAALLATPTLLHAQIIKGEVFAGAIASQVDGDECYGFKKFGVHAGAGALVPITSFMDVGLEVLFSQKGAHKRDSITYNSTYPHAYNLTLNYVEVPLMVYFTDKDAISVGVGVSYGRMVGLKELVDRQPSNYEGVGIGMGDGCLHWRSDDETLPDISKVQDLEGLSQIVYSVYPDSTYIPQVVANSNTYRPNDFSICADVKVRIWESLHAEVRYQYSLRPIRTRLYYANISETLPSQIRLQYNNTFTVRLVYVFNERRSKANKEASKKN